MDDQLEDLISFVKRNARCPALLPPTVEIKYIYSFSEYNTKWIKGRSGAVYKKLVLSFISGGENGLP